VQAATYIAAVAVSQGDVFVRGARAEHMEMLLNRYAEMGVSITPHADGLRVVSQQRLRSIDFATLPYPGIATLSAWERSTTICMTQSVCSRSDHARRHIAEIADY